MAKHRLPTNIEFLLDLNRRIREETLTNYYKDPIVCRYCGKTVDVKSHQSVAEVRKKKFCDRICAAKYNNERSIKRSIKRSKVCWDIVDTSIIGGIIGRKTKGQIFREYGNYTAARNAIRKHAQKRYQASTKPKVCAICGYDKYIEVCHIKPVSNFSNASYINDINNLNNLIALCPNHHWELDNNYLEL